MDFQQKRMIKVKMKSPIIFILFISFAGCVGFTVGMSFNGFYNKDIVSETIAQSNEVQRLVDCYTLIIQDDIVLKDIENINSINDLNTVKKKYRESGLLKIGLLNKQADSMKKDAANPSVIIEIENSAKKYKNHFKQLSN